MPEMPLNGETLRAADAGARVPEANVEIPVFVSVSDMIFVKAVHFDEGLAAGGEIGSNEIRDVVVLDEFAKPRGKAQSAIEVACWIFSKETRGESKNPKLGRAHERGIVFDESRWLGSEHHASSEKHVGNLESFEVVSHEVLVGEGVAVHEDKSVGACTANGLVEDAGFAKTFIFLPFVAKLDVAGFLKGLDEFSGLRRRPVIGDHNLEITF